MGYRSSLVRYLKSLPFDTLGVIGRDSEISELRHVFESQFDMEPKVVLVSGQGGVGKTTLVKTLEEFVDGERGFFCMGKQEQMTTQTFQVVAEAMTMLAAKILESESEMKRIEEGIADALSPQLALVLLESSPELRPLFRSVNLSTAEHDSSFDAEYKKRKAQLAYRQFLRFLCTKERPVVLAIDDLQWCDPATTTLLESLAGADCDIQGLVVVGTYRDNEVDKDHPLAEVINRFRKAKQKDEKFKEIRLENFKLEVLNQVVAHLVELHPSKSMELAEVILSKTHGNIFFILQMIRSLHQGGLIYFDVMNYRWEWDLQRIKTETNLTENVADMLCSKISMLSSSTEAALKIASCIGTRFDLEVVEGVLNSEYFGRDDDEDGDYRVPVRAQNQFALFGEGDGTKPSIAGCAQQKKDKMQEQRRSAVYSDVKDAVTIDLLSHVEGTNKYRFSHDRIQQAAYSLLQSEEERSMAHYLVGRYLRQSHSESVMVVAEQMNRGSVHLTKDNEILDLVKLNLEAATQSIKKAAFSQARTFLRKAATLLPSAELWETCSAQAWSLHIMLAEVNCVLGDYKVGTASVQELLKYANTEEALLRANLIKMRLLHSQGETRQMVELGLYVVKKAGVRMPSKARKHHLLIEYVAIRRLLKKRKETDIITQPAMKDEKMVNVCSFLNYIGIGSFFRNDPNMLFLCHMKTLRLSFLHGPCVHTAMGLTSFGILLAMFGDFDAAFATGQLAERLARRLDDRYENALVYSNLYVFLHPLRRPLQASIDPLLKHFGQAIEVGNLASACACCADYVFAYYVSGLPLGPLVNDSAAIRRNFLTKNENTMRFSLDVNVQAAFSLSGRDPDPFEFRREIKDFDKELALAKEKNNVVALLVYWTMKLSVCYILDPDDARTGASAIELWKLSTETVKAHYFYLIHSFYSGLTCIALFRRTKRRKYRKYGKYIRNIEAWNKKGVPWVLHFLLILQAERAWLERKSMDEVKDAFDAAIRVATRTGFLKDCALANERCALFFASQGDNGWFSFYMEKAIRLYREWGAGAKVDLLSQSHRKTLARVDRRASRVDSTSSTIRGRERFTTRYASIDLNDDQGQQFDVTHE